MSSGGGSGGNGGRGLKICILSGSSRTVAHAYGLHQDARIVEQILRETIISGGGGGSGGGIKIDSIEHNDAYTYGTGNRGTGAVDINIHLEVPCRMAWRYGRINIVVVNQEWWYKDAWKWVTEPREKGGADLFLFKTQYARSMFPELEDSRVRVVAWRPGTEISNGLSFLNDNKKNAFLYLLGASANKAAAAAIVCGAWRAEWPPLHVYGSKMIMDNLRGLYGDAAERGVFLLDKYESESERVKAQANYKYHVVASAAEGFGYTFAEAAAVGALPLWTDIGVYKELYGSVMGDVGKIDCRVVDLSGADMPFPDKPVMFKVEDVVRAVESLLGLSKEDHKSLSGKLRHLSTVRIKEFRNGCRSLLKSAIKLLFVPGNTAAYPPKVPAVADFPHVAIVTLTHNRPKWFANMANNILKSDYPTDKLTWIIADDSDGNGRVDGAVAKFQSANPFIRVRYLSMPKKLPIGEKRNKACLAAPGEASVFMMMDDDDHYPVSSIRARMAYLTEPGVECVYCSTLPMYDAKNYISAMNVPPLNLAPAERVSEASLAFTRKFFEEGRFPSSVSVAEGEGFIVGREHLTAEISPRGIIVSFLHGKNATSRRVPESTEPNGCHYGFSDEFFTYISELALD